MNFLDILCFIFIKFVKTFLDWILTFTEFQHFAQNQVLTLPDDLFYYFGPWIPHQLNTIFAVCVWCIISVEYRGAFVLEFIIIMLKLFISQSQLQYSKQVSIQQSYESPVLLLRETIKYRWNDKLFNWPVNQKYIYIIWIIHYLFQSLLSKMPNKVVLASQMWMNMLIYFVIYDRK